ncbi:MAG: 30S ribosomal protein S18 [Cyanobacteria bacterium P01_H01_bin.74]
MRKNYDRNKKKICFFCHANTQVIDFKNPQILLRFLTDRGKILSRRITGTCAYHQRMLAKTVKLARHSAVIPYVIKSAG